jgi:putative molybdopterin biosynthesis protein
VVGSHDNTLDLLADEIRARGTGLTLSSNHVGSMGGLMALRRGVCHLAGCHLLDTSDGSYNGSYIRRMLPGLAMRRVNLVMRDQGLIVPPGNPKGISGIADLARPDVTFINRQAGSGTRILLDWRLGQLGITAAGIRGYDTEEFTHMAVAVAVLGGSADVGLGICAAARALGLAFIPVVTEQYDLVTPAAFFDTPPFQTMLGVIRSERFKSRVDALGGYGTEKSGVVME